MSKKALQRARNLLTRRRALQAVGAVFGASAFGCRDDGSGVGGTSSATGESSSSGSVESSDTTTTDSSTSSASTSDESTSGSGESSTTEGVDECEVGSNLTAEELLADIDHIVVLMMENRSFDHYFGARSLVEGLAVDGLTGNEFNLDQNGNPVEVFPLTNLEPDDPPHGWDSIHAQFNNGQNDGFVTEHQDVNPGSYTEVMGYHVRDQLPVLYSLADNYTLCERWFCSVLGPTWPNRYYLNCATSGGEMDNQPEFGLTSIWDLLEPAGISAINYYGDAAWVWGGLVDFSFTDSLDEFFVAAEAGDLPRFSMIDPAYLTNDDHPPHSIVLGQALIASVYQALAQSPHWERSLLIITYDEHGGFYDHVVPPTMEDERPAFRQLGFRVPSLVIGPTVRRGCTNSTKFDHVSVIATLTRRFGLPSLNARVDATRDVSSCINPDYIGNPQPPAHVPGVMVSLREALASISTRSPQPELWDAIDHGPIQLPPGFDRRGRIRETVVSLLEHGQRLGAVVLVP